VLIVGGRVSETVDWKKKHHDSLREMEADERRWRTLEELLRKLVGRLCSVASGSDPRLETQLERLAVAVRSNADAVELKALFDSLTDAVRALERSGAADPAPTGSTSSRLPVEPLHPPAVQKRWETSCKALSTLLDRLAETNAEAPLVAALRAELVTVDDDRAFAVLLGRVADLVAGRSATLAHERAEAAAMLSQVTERLEEMALYLATATAEEQRGHEESESLNLDVLAQMSSLTDDLRKTDDLPTLRALVADRLEAVAVNVRGFREREHRRFVEHVSRSERMRARISELEQESRVLNRNLDQEKKRSRIDPLTRVANRAAFDERFAAELVRYKRFSGPIAVLVWDIDHFKVINDTYGHRTGDAVLREVATVLSQGRREVDFFARYGGEEFVSLLIGTPVSNAIRVADQMRGAVESLKFHFRGAPVPVTVSCGLTDVREADSMESVFDRADRALYAAKDGGRNRCVAA
jgi:diguanylate cyclase